MSFENPTPLRVGANGTLDGWRVRVAARVVMGMEDGGETYYWQEFFLVDGFGRSATLVYEETESGPEWKLFKPLVPIRAMTADEAASKKVGDPVNLDGTPTRVTLVDQSRVYHIDGIAPEGIEVGDVANYFNADTGARMLVASWSDEEVEYYEGNDIAGEKVAAAFGFTLPAPEAASAFTGGGSPQVISTKFFKYAGVAVVLAVVLFNFFSCGPGRGSRAPQAGPPAKKAAPALRLAAGARGMLDGREYTIRDQAVVEMALVSGRFDRREYSLSSDTIPSALLVHGLNGGAKEWHLLLPARREGTLANLDPYAAATLRREAPVSVGDSTMRIVNLFQSRTTAVDGPNAATAWPKLQYGFLAREKDEVLVARWTETGIQFHRGRAVPEAQVLAALGAATPKR